MERMVDLKLQASNETLYTVLDAIEAHLEKCGCPKSVQTEILVAVEELYVNIASYAYGDKKGEAAVQMDVLGDPGRCRVTLMDHGMPYNPLEREDPDITLSAEERGIGGLGIYMVKQTMDHVEYRYENGCNILTIEKGIGAEENTCG
ncbi:MAG: ATP-binding protein [Lachnospiraceae bacterium]|nr:ATP-binding protein [Lachnospiraceae bacterium]